MIQIEKNKRKTDQAWNRLYNRLDNEGLIPETNSRNSLRPALLRWGMATAAVVAICVSFSVIYFSGKETQPAQPLLTQQNKEKSTLVTTLEDGSVVYLAEATSLQYPEHFATEKREVSLQGDALFDITGNRKRPFLIETEEVRVEVLGTAFNVKTNGNVPFELSVQRGLVKVTLKKDGQDTYVKAGETVTLLERKLQLRHTPDKKQFASYTRNMRFKDERLADILRVINLNEPETQIQAPPQLSKRKLTVAFANDSPETMVELICMALNLKYSKEKNTFILSE
ncbi:FecR family protein [Bacteroides sp.]